MLVTSALLRAVRRGTAKLHAALTVRGLVSGIMVGIYAAGFKDALKELQDKIVEAGGSCDDM